MIAVWVVIAAVCLALLLVSGWLTTKCQRLLDEAEDQHREALAILSEAASLLDGPR